MRRLTALAALPLLALAGAGQSPRPDPRPDHAPPVYPSRSEYFQPVCACACPALVPARQQDTRVAALIIDSVRNLGSDNTARVLSALATNPTIRPETELLIVEAAKNLGSEARTGVLVSLAKTPRTAR